MSLLQVPLFANTELGFTKLLALSIKPVLFLSDEYIVRKGDIGSEVRHTLSRQEIAVIGCENLDVLYPSWLC